MTIVEKILVAFAVAGTLTFVVSKAGTYGLESLINTGGARRGPV
jgi:hypothetical protein